MSLLFSAVKASDTLDRYRERIDLLNFAVLAKDERLVIAAMFFHYTPMRYL